MSSERDLLTIAVERLEAVAAALQAGAADGDEATRLADEALALSAEIGERLPRVIREIEDAAHGRTGPQVEPPASG